MLKLEHFIGKGATRLCFHHPDDTDKCVKVAMRSRNIPQLQQELDAVKACQAVLGKYMPYYGNELVQTNIGPGLVCELIKNDDGTTAPSLASLRHQKKLLKEIKPQIIDFAQIVLQNSIPLYDFNVANFVIQTKNGEKHLRLTDIKTYNNYKPWIYLHTEKFIPAVSKMIVKRRLKRLINWFETNTQ